MFVIKMDGDIFKYEMTNHLNISDLIAVKRINKKYYNDITTDYIKERIIKEIEDRLVKLFGSDWKEFKEQLERAGAIISGSFIIQCILNEDWKTDIDIYITSTFSKEKIKRMSFGGKRSAGKIQEIETWLMNHNFITTRYEGSDRYNEGISQDIRCVRNYGFCEKNRLEEYQNAAPYDKYADNSRFIDNNKPQIQIIQVNRRREEILGFILDNFDLDICKNIYGVKNSQSYINIYNLNQIISKQNCTGFGYNSKLTLARYKKYTNYGFRFPNISLNVYQKFIERPEDFYLFSLKERVPATTNIFNEFELVKGNNDVFTPKRSCQYFSIGGNNISFRLEYLIEHPKCDICSLIKTTFNYDCYYHFNVTNSFKNKTAVEFIFVVGNP